MIGFSGKDSGAVVEPVDQFRMQMRKVVVATAMLIPIISAGVVLGLPNLLDECVANMKHWSVQAEHAWSQRDFDREPCWGETTSGAAFADYAVAVEHAARLGKDDEALLRALRLEPESVDPDEARDFALRWSVPLSRVSEGAHRIDARPPIEWKRGFGNGNATLLVSRDLVNAATVEVRRRLKAGELAGAVQMSLDTATFAVDLLQSPVLVDQMVACALLTVIAGETWRDEDLQRLDDPALELLAVGLQRIDDRCPLVFDWRGESLLLANTLLHPGEVDYLLSAPSDSLKTFEYGWSERWAAADAVLQQVAMWEQLETDSASEWKVCRRELGSLAQSAAMQSNPVLRIAFSNVLGAERHLRSVAAVVRLLRMAVAYHLGAEVQPLRDPFGDGPFEVTRTDDGAIVLSCVAVNGSRTVSERTVTLR